MNPAHVYPASCRGTPVPSIGLANGLGARYADASDDSSGDGHAHHHHSRFSRFRRRFRTNRHHHGSNPPLLRNLAADDFAGIARIEIISVR
ncbi:hypothetical protein B296_00004709 [Ensete ventricosum]|uniref:Uncharacterized protein n=1 Tax=Ensete ventricosum TaxID=4639 RepID=A0A427AYH2_ENSVE|nr:hypothetical protein B296_00004709 [Ensete ventricosum]